MGGIWLNEEISLRFFIENMNTDLYINILKQKNNNEINRICIKGYILISDNTTSPINHKTIDFIKMQR